MIENIKDLEKKAKKDAALSFRLGVAYFNGDETERDYKKAFYWMDKAASGGYGDSNCRYYLGRMYEKGLGVKNDYVKARKYYDSASRAGNVKAKVKLADLYRKGLGCKKNPEGAMNLYIEARDLGSIDAKMGIADLYLNGEGVAKDEAQAFGLYTELAKKGNDKAKYSLAYCYQNGFGTEKNPFMAGHYLVPAAKEGDSNAQCYLALCFLKGDAVKQNLPKAVYWFKKAATQGNEVAMFNLAFCMQRGWGMEKDEKGAFDLYLQLAKAGHTKAYAEVARCYRFGIGTKENAVKAYRWIQKGVKLNEPSCLCMMGYFFYDGKPYVRRSLRAAFKHFSKAASRGSSAGKYVVGQMYYNGIYVRKDVEKGETYMNEAADELYAPALYRRGLIAERDGDNALAVDCYYRAAQDEYAPALVKMGIISERGEIVARDENAAFFYFGRAAERESARGCYGLARCYEQGIGTEISRKKAFEYFKLSATSGYADALLEVGYRYMFGIGTKKELMLAKQFLNQSAKEGNPIAPYYLGLGHATGKYFKKDRKLALKFFEKSASEGYVSAYTKLGIAYGKETKDFKTDLKKSAYYFNLAVENGDGEALAYLANCYMTGSGVNKDEEKVKELLDESCNRGCINGIYMKGFMLYSGLIYEEDKAEGLAMITRAADACYRKACNFLVAYYSAKDTADPAKALQYKELALLTGEINYAYEVARSYESGKTVVADGDKASFYYAKLALSEDKHGKKKKALKNLKRFKSSDGIHWDSSTSRKMKKKAEKVKEKDPDAYVLAEETVKAAVDESLSEKSE